MHVIKEATTSSRIEGTQTNIAETVQKENQIDPEKKMIGKNFKTIFWL